MRRTAIVFPGAKPHSLRKKAVSSENQRKPLFLYSVAAITALMVCIRFSAS